MVFSLDKYTGNYVMHCRTIEEAVVFLNFLADNGRSWSSGKSYRDVDRFGTYRDKTCYAFNRGEWCEVEWYKDHGYNILNFSDYDWEKSGINEIDDSSFDMMLSLI